jgi:DNA-directed RNA polymerase specialized sigma24 family protein
MSYKALVESFCKVDSFPVDYTDVIKWIRDNTDHKNVNLYGVTREKKAYRGAFRRRAIPQGVYGADPDIVVDILYGIDLPREWKNLVITKECLHVFDPNTMQVNTPEDVEKLIPAVIHAELKKTLLPALADNFGVYRALMVLLPPPSRDKLFKAVEDGQKTISEIAQYVDVPEEYVDVWLKYGRTLGELCLSY